MKDSIYFKQAELLLRVLPFVGKEQVFALKGGTAINFFVKDLPRLSVDIDLAYLPISEREAALADISNALNHIRLDIKGRVPETTVTQKKLVGTNLVKGLVIRSQDATIKIEPNLVIRGSVFPPEKRILSKKAQNLFELSVESLVLSPEDLYAGKICAALDRQHPRDLFDIFMLLKDKGFSEGIRKAFIVYLISHPRPMIEILNPRFMDISKIYETEFREMEITPVTLEELESTRERIAPLILNSLTKDEKLFILSVKKGTPRWDLLDLPGIENLPSVKWKLLNIKRMKSSKHSEALKKLEDYLGSGR